MFLKGTPETSAQTAPRRRRSASQLRQPSPAPLHGQGPALGRSRGRGRRGRGRLATSGFHRGNREREPHSRDAPNTIIIGLLVRLCLFNYFVFLLFFCFCVCLFFFGGHFWKNWVFQLHIPPFICRGPTFKGFIRSFLGGTALGSKGKPNSPSLRNPCVHTYPTMQNTCIMTCTCIYIYMYILGWTCPFPIPCGTNSQLMSAHLPPLPRLWRTAL